MNHQVNYIKAKRTHQSNQKERAIQNFQYLDQDVKQYLELDNQKFRKKYLHIILQANVLIKSGLELQALQILQKGQKQIQQNFKCGRKGNQMLFVIIVHNLASIYQKLDNKNRSLDKIRILLHFLNNHRISKLQQQSSFEQKIIHLNLTVNIAKYYIYFLAFAIQLKMFQAASIPMNRVVQYFRKFQKQYTKTQLKVILINKNMTQQLLSDIGQFQSLFSSNSFQQILQITKQSSLKLRRPPSRFQQDYAKIKKINLKNLTTISPIEIQFNENQNEGYVQKNYKGKVYQNGLLQFAVALFLIGKSINQSANLRFKNNQDINQKMIAFDKSKKYTLWSLYFACQLCNYLTQFHQQVISYFQLNFQKNFQQEGQKKNIKTVNLLQSPELRNQNLWKQIKQTIGKLNKDVLQQNQLLFNKAVPTFKSKDYLDERNVQKQKNKQQNNREIQSQNKIEQKYQQRVYKRSNREKSVQVFKQRNKRREQSSHQINRQKKLKDSKSYKFINVRHNDQLKKDTVIKNKTKSKSKLGKSLSLSQSNQKKFKSSLSKNKTKHESKEEKNGEKVKPSQQYYQTSPKKKRVTNPYFKKQQRNQLAKYLNLQKKMKQAGKQLSKKKRELFNSLKKL